MITYISKEFGGRAGDKLITEDSGVQQLLERGDIVALWIADPVVAPLFRPATVV